MKNVIIMPSKYDSVPIKLHRARVDSVCSKCGKLIIRGEYVAYQRDTFIHVFIKNKYCEDCFKKFV